MEEMRAKNEQNEPKREGRAAEMKDASAKKVEKERKKSAKGSEKVKRKRYPNFAPRSPNYRPYWMSDSPEEEKEEEEERRVSFFKDEKGEKEKRMRQAVPHPSDGDGMGAGASKAESIQEDAPPKRKVPWEERPRPY